jgi:hypothetical protein
MKWLTWENVGVDRMACAWLIVRFIDPQAKFLFIPAGGAIPEGCEPYDIPSVRLSHRRGHCSFHTMLLEYQLHDPILQRIAQIVDEADSVQEVTLEPVAAGLDFLCHGLRKISPDDMTAIQHGHMIYEALYAQLASEEKS